jgi:hypothetical protein
VGLFLRSRVRNHGTTALRGHSFLARFDLDTANCAREDSIPGHQKRKMNEWRDGNQIDTHEIAQDMLKLGSTLKQQCSETRPLSPWGLCWR